MIAEKISKSDIDIARLPKHIAIIMDGNGRWAKKRGLPRHFGHQEGMNRVIDIVEEAKDIGIKYLTLYAFSTENWKRPKFEVDSLMNLLVLFIRKELQRLVDNGIKLNILGDWSILPELPKKEIKRALEATKDNNDMVLNIALNYGGRQEISRAVKLILEDHLRGNIDVGEIDEETIRQYIYTNGQPDPDLIIRPSGELRLSNFLTYQSAYSELWFSDVLWPDFDKIQLYRAILDYQKRDRRFGGI